MTRALLCSSAILLGIACGGQDRAAAPPALAIADARPAVPSEPIEPIELPSLSTGGLSLCGVGNVQQCARHCDAGNALSCARLAQAKPEPAVARSIFARSCELGYAVACASFAEMLALGAGGPSDVKLARRLFATSCEREVARGCFGSGALEPDAVRARQSFESACALGDPEGCMEAIAPGDRKGLLRAMRTALRAAPSKSTAARSLGCEDGTAGFESVSMFGAVELYCATPDGQKQGPFVTWASREDLVQGAPHGVMRERGRFEGGKREGLCEAWDLDGKFRSKGAYRRGREEGDWDLISGAGERERGRFENGLREGPWIEEHGRGTIEVGYLRGKRDGKLVERNGGLTIVEEWREGMRQGKRTRTWEGIQTCVDSFVDDKRVGESVCRDAKGRVIP